MLFTEKLGIFLAEHLVEMLAGVGEFVGARHDKRVVGYVDDALQPRHLGGIDFRGHHVAHEEQFGIGVVDDVMHLFGHELVQDGHGDGPVGERGQESHGPISTVASAECNLVAFHHTAALKHDVEFFNLPGHVMVLQRGSLVVSQRIKVPMVNDALLDQCVETGNVFHRDKQLILILVIQSLFVSSGNVRP